MSISKKAQHMQEIALEDLPEMLELGGSEQPEVVFYTSEPSKDVVLDMHDEELAPSELTLELVPEESAIELADHGDHMSDSHEPKDHFADLEMEDLPGVDELDPELELELEKGDEDEQKSDDDSSKKAPKSKDRWDFTGLDSEEFATKAKDILANVPKHSGYDRSGIERAISYLDRLDSEISKAMRSDHDGKLDFNMVEDLRAKIEKGQDSLDARLDKIGKGGKRSKRAATTSEIVKEGQRAPQINGIVITVPLLISRIGRVCINGAISAGHSIEDIFHQQSKKWKLTDREQAELMQFISDCGYPLREDRGYMPDEEVLTDSEDNPEWSQNFKG